MPWYPMIMGCPVSGCSNMRKEINWVCADDGDTMFVCEEGRLACRTRQHNNLIINWKFDCGGRDGPHRNTHYQHADITGFGHAMSIALPLLGTAGAQWASKLLLNVEKQYKG